MRVPQKKNGALVLASRFIIVQINSDVYKKNCVKNIFAAKKVKNMRPKMRKHVYEKIRLKI